MNLLDITPAGALTNAMMAAIESDHRARRHDCPVEKKPTNRAGVINTTVDAFRRCLQTVIRMSRGMRGRGA